MSRRVPRSPERADAAAASIIIPSNNPSRATSPVTTSSMSSSSRLDLLATPRSTRSLTHRQSLVPLPSFGAPLETECLRCGVPMPTSVCPLCAYEEEDNTRRRAQERSVERERISSPTTPVRSLADHPRIGESAAVVTVPTTVVPPSNATSAAGSGPAHSANAVPLSLRTPRPRARSSPPPSMYGRLSPDELDLFYRPDHLTNNDDAGDTVPTSSQSGDGSATPHPQWQPQTHSSPSTSLCPDPSSRPSTLTRGSSHSASGSSSGSPHTSLRRARSQNHRHTRSHSLFDTISMNASDFPAASAASDYASRTTNPTFNPSLGFRPSQVRLLSRSAVSSTAPHTAHASPSMPLAPIPNSPVRSAYFRDSPTPSSPEPRPDPTNVSDSQHEFDTDADHFARVPIPDVAYMPPSPASSTPSLTESIAIIVPTQSDYESLAAGTDRRSLLPSPAPFVPSKTIIAPSVPAESEKPERGTHVVAASSSSPRTRPPPSLAIPAYQPTVSATTSPATSPRTSPAATSSPSASIRRAYFPITPGTPLSPRGPPPSAPLPPTPGPASPRARERKISSPSMHNAEPSTDQRPRPPSMPAPDWRMEYLKQYPTPSIQKRARQGSAPVSPVAGVRRVSPSSKRLSADQEARQQRLAALATAAESEVEPITDTDVDETARPGLAHLGLRPLLLEQKLRDDAGRLSVSRTRPLSLSSNASVRSRRSTKSNQSVPRSLHRSAAQVDPDELPRTSLSVPPSPNATRVEFSDASPGRSTAPTSSPARSGKAKRLSVTSKSSKSGDERDRKRLSTGSTAPATPNSKRNSATRFSIVSFATRSRKNSTRSGTSTHTRNASSQYAVPVPPVPVPELPRRDSGVTSAATGGVIRRSRSSSKIGQFLRQVGRTLAGKPATDRQGAQDREDDELPPNEDEPHATQEGSVTPDVRSSTTVRSRGDTLLGVSIDASSYGHGVDLGRSRSHDLLRGTAPASTLRAASALSVATSPPADDSPLNARAPRKWFGLLQRPSRTRS